MENSTYDEVSVTPVNTNETYSRIQTKINPSYELRCTAHDQGRINKKGNANGSQKNTKSKVVLIIMIVLLLLFMVASIVLSVVTLTSLTFEQSKVLSQLCKTNDDLKTALATAQSNISQVLKQLDTQLSNFISQQSQYSSLQTQINCGLGPWYRLILLNMSNPSQECPPTWREYNIDGVRACGRPASQTGSCAAILHLTGQMYSRVCGRVIGYRQGTPDAFRPYANNDIDLDGINITRGTQHDHIWSYIAGGSCPCSSNDAFSPPQSIGDHYYCESFNPNRSLSDDQLWDGQQCEGTCCTGTNSPPWFSVQILAPTTDAIEVSICCDQSTSDEDVPIELLEIYVQ